jgi:DNA-directed RNA polymerase subunit RPC12/RpoP
MRSTYTCPECWHKAPRDKFLWINPDEVECPECGEAFGTRFIDQVHDSIYTWRVKYHVWISMRQIKAGKVISQAEFEQRIKTRFESKPTNQQGIRLTTFLLIVAGAVILLLLLLPIPLLIPLIGPIGR